MIAVSWPFSFDHPQWLWLLAAIPPLAAVSLHLLRGIELPRRIAAVALRCLVIVALAAALAGVEWVHRNEHIAVMFVLDSSQSIPAVLGDKAREYIRQVVRKGNPDNRVGAVACGADADVTVIPSRAGFDIVSFATGVNPDRTDLSEGMRLAMAAFPPGFARRIVLLSDGNQNSGQISEALDTAAANRIPVDVVPLEYRHGNEIMFDRIVVPSQAGEDVRVPLRMILRSRTPTEAEIDLYHNGQRVPLVNSRVQLSGDMKRDPFTEALELRTGGVHVCEAHVRPVERGHDTVVENNKATAFTFVQAEGKVLLLSGVTADDEVLADALQREKILLQHASVDELGAALDLVRLQDYSVVILANVPADTFTDEQHKALAGYVRDGGGLIMTGGDNSFGAGGWIGKPVEEVSPVSFEIRHKRQMPRGALAIVMHSCELDNGNYWGQQVAMAAVNTLSSLDYCGVVAYTWSRNGANWEVPMDTLKDKPAVIAKIKQMQIGDMPSFAPTMDMAVKELTDLKDAAQRHIIIISDGDPSPPSDACIQRMVDNNITASTVGIGYGVHVMDQTLKDIARKTGGKFYAVKNPSDLPRIFVKEARTVKRALIENKPFQPFMVNPSDELIAGLGGLPGLGGLVLTERKPDSLVPVMRQGLQDGQKVEDPVLAHWNFEMGKMAVFTSGQWPRWGADWAAWDRFSKFWGQTVRWAMRSGETGKFDVITRLDGEKGRVVIEALNKDASYLNFLRIAGTVTDPQMDRQPLELVQTGPGRYEADFKVKNHGNYLVNMHYAGPDNKAGVIRSGLSIAYSPEFRELGTNRALLREAAERTGGQLLEMNAVRDRIFERPLPPAEARRPMWRWLVGWVLLPLFLLDVATRRLASTLAMSFFVEATVFVVALGTLGSIHRPAASVLTALIIAELVGWAVRWQFIVPSLFYLTATVTGLSRAGQRGAEAMAQLKTRRDQVREKLESTPDSPAASPPPIPLEPAADPGRRFEAGEASDGAAADLGQALGGAKAEGGKPTQARPTKPAPPKGAGTGDVASRLRQAKSRARDSIKERTDDQE